MSHPHHGLLFHIRDVGWIGGGGRPQEYRGTNKPTPTAFRYHNEMWSQTVRSGEVGDLRA